MKSLVEYINESVQAHAAVAAWHLLTKNDPFWHNNSKETTLERDSKKDTMHAIGIIIHNVDAHSDKKIYDFIQKLVNDKIISSIDTVEDWEHIGKTGDVLITIKRYFNTKQCVDLYKQFGKDLIIDGKTYSSVKEVEKI